MLSHLRDGYQERGIIGSEGIYHRRVALEASDKRSGVAIGYLQAHAQQAREDEEHSHLLGFEELERIEAPSLHPALRLLLDHRTLWQSETVEEEHDAQHTRYEELEVRVLELIGILAQEEREGAIVPSGTVDYPHGEDEAHGTKHTDRWEILDRIQPIALQNGEGRGIGQRQSRHIEATLKV